MTSLKRTGLYDAHLRSGGKIVAFAGWKMPVQYSSIIDEHQTVRTAAGMFDVSHMGEVLFSGPDALANIQMLVSNDISKLKPNRAVYTGMLYPGGTFVDDLLVYRLSEDTFLLVINAANTLKDYEWMRDNIRGNLVCENVTDQYTQIAVQGPNSIEILKKLTPVDLASIRYYRFERDSVAGVDSIISRTGYTGEPGFELYFDATFSDKVWDAVLETGNNFGLKPAGLGCRDTLRLEAGMALYGNDIDDQHTPLEAGLDWIVKLSKDDFIGKSALVEQLQKGLTRHLIGFELTERAIPRKGYEIFSGNEPIGEVTSGTLSITLGKPVGMGYVRHGFESLGTNIEIMVRGKKFPGRVVALPFYSRTRGN
ncbi:glycine cleavage system aminomethyltransferase GcvT [bacterium]|nr:glycine cleavage system aminomethyltransferase GcvT [candidate division CSSED10-310 bacterium]